MYKLRFYQEAKIDYTQIGEYISQDNPFYANEVLNKIDESINTILSFPFIGVEIENGVRKIVEPKYKITIIYEIKQDTLYIVSIFKYKNIWE